MARLDSAAGRDTETGISGPRGTDRQDALRALLAGCARRDQAAFERLYRLTAVKLYSLCFHVVRRRELAEEVLQEVYAQIWREASRFEGYRAAPMTWMTVMARNRSIDVLRRRANTVRPFDEDAAHRESDEPASDPMAYAQRLGESEALRRCLERLREGQRDAILLAFFQGLSHRELSDALEQPVGTVKSWIRRGLVQLKECLEQ